MAWAVGRLLQGRGVEEGRGFELQKHKAAQMINDIMVRDAAV